MKKAKNRETKNKSDRSTQKLMGIERISEHCIGTRQGKLAYYKIQPTNISVLPAEEVAGRVRALLNVIKSLDGLELLATDGSESFEGNKDFYRDRLQKETEPAIRRLLEQDFQHLDRIQMLMASARSFYILIRLQELDAETLNYLTQIEKMIQNSGFRVRQVGKQELARMLALYFEQNVTTTRFYDLDGGQWMETEEVRI